VNPEVPPPDHLEQQALSAFREGDLQAAIDAFLAARQRYLDQGHHSKAAEMGCNLAVSLLEAGRAEDALQAVEGIPEIFLDLGSENLAAQAFGNLGAALEANQRYQAAEAAYRNAADLFSKHGDIENSRYTLQALSRLQLRQGRPVEALTTMEAGLEGQTQLGLRDRLLRRLLKLPYRLFGK
jgi:tetratricopeptide (TPR) repeat protein